MTANVAFDFARFKAAFEERRLAEWLACYAEDAVWLEYRHDAPPRNPHRMRGREEIEAFLSEICAADLQLEISNEVLNRDRCAFMVTCRLRDGRRIVENVIIHVRDGVIHQQVDVEAWD